MRTSSPKLALCNFINDTKTLRELALDSGFDGVDWTFNQHNLPRNPRQELELTRNIAGLHPLEVRYHCFFPNLDVGSVREEEALQAMRLLRSVCRLVSGLHGRVVTIHVGLGRDSASDLSWERTLQGLTDLGAFASRFGLQLCIENLARGWTSRPLLFDKILTESSLWGTLDIGHAQVCASVRTQLHAVEDFVEPHRGRFLNAHVYHEETSDGHVPPQTASDIAHRLALLLSLPLCNWWVLELREEAALLQTMRLVRSFLQNHEYTTFGNDRDLSLIKRPPQGLFRAAS